MSAKGTPRYARIVSLLLCLALAATLIPAAPVTLGVENGLSADGKTYYISTFNDLVAAAGHSRTAAGNTIKYVLKNDIAIQANELATLQGLDIDHLTFGDKDHYFLGEFDGQGHTISGLNYDNNLFKVATRTGLFSYVGHKSDLSYHTYIHDLTIEGASIHADYISGIVAGEAYNTRFVNVNVVNSAMSVNPADNTLVLITDGGVLGGALAGFARHCTFYNCGSRNTTIRTNSVSGVAALSGKPLYLGGLVGQADTFTEIEYCRVMGGEVKNRYESSVGALGGFTCYAGGLAGGLSGGTKVIDCFATCNVSFYAATYVGVGAGCSGHAGGLAGKTDKDGNGGVTIRRCHYAGGAISSYQYNTLLLMIPVQIANDVNRSGLVDKCDNTTVEDSFFNYADTIGPENGKPANVLGSKTVTDEYGPQPDERYMDREFWENRGYDFAGNVDRSTGSNTFGPHLTPQPYYNKWVMYYYDDPVTGARRGYPVHGLSVAATFDFPGAGKVTLKPTLGADSLSLTAAETADPYRFAVLGFYPTECDPTYYTDGTETKGGVALSAAMNAGYRLTGWYLAPDVAAAGLPDGQHGYFDNLFADESKRCDDRLPVTPPGQTSADYPHIAVADNQLYVARCQAQVEFRGLDGGTLDKTSGAPEGAPDLSDDWYFYASPLPAVAPAAGPSDPNAKLIGWTTTPDSDATPGWEQINTTQLDELKKAGTFYEPGAPIVSTLTLYPVYANQLLNIHVEIEGYDDPGDVTYRAAVGQTYVTSDGDAITLRVKSFAAATEADQPTADFPDGYRFLGWYENDLCVSRERDYTLPATVDLNAEHTYQARFQYRVRYYAVAGQYEGDEAGIPFNKPHAVRWELYNTTFNADVPVPIDYHYTFNGWYEGIPKDALDSDCAPVAVPADKQITDPYDVHDHLTDGGGTHYDVFVTTDFPGSAIVSQTGSAATIDNFIVNVAPKANYNFLFWAGGRPSGNWVGTSTSEDWTVGGVLNAIYHYGFEAHMTANVVFHTKEEAEKATVQRRYEEKVFLDADTPHTYIYPISKDNTVIDTAALSLPNPPSEAFPFTTDMTVPGYYFIGWIDKDDADTQNALAAIYNVPADPYTTTNVALAKNYVLTESDIVTRAMPNVYPVYAKYDVKTATNVLMEVPGVVQKPNDPACALADDTAQQTTATVTAYNNVAVDPSAPEGDKYTIEAITVSIDGGEPITLPAPADASGDWVVTYPVVPGRSYLFTALYRPLVVVFHQNGNTDAKVLVRNYGDPIGRPAPEVEGGVAEPVMPTVQDDANELNHALFVGWTEATPADPAGRPYHFFPESDGKSSFQLAGEFGYWTPGQTEDTIVTHPMELWPVYATYTVDVNSNIDNDLKTTKGYTDETLWRDVRSLDRTSANTVATTVRAAEVDGYKFVGWYTGVTLDETGEYNNFETATLISEAGEYTLEGDEPFATDNYLYTARYKAVYKVIYHGRGRDGGPVMYTNYLYEGEDEDKALNMEITETVDQPVLDDAGNPVLNPDGTVKTQPKELTYHQPLDPTPYHMIYGTMDPNESFGQWECHEPDTAINPGADLVNIYDPWSFQPLLPNSDPDATVARGLIARVGTSDREINLYPTVWRVTVTDSAGQDITDQVTIDIDMSEMKADYSDVKVYVCFDPANPYTQSKLTVQVQRTRWIETEDPDNPGRAGDPDIAIRGRNGVTVIPYLDASKTLPLAEGKPTANLYGDGDEQHDGYAVFEFTDSPLKLTKNAPADRKGETFLFQVERADKTKSWTVPVTCDSDVTDSEGAVTGCTGSATINLPIGTYSVTEAENWAWALAPVYTVRVAGVLQEASDAHKAVALPPLPAGTAHAAEVVCTNSVLPGAAQWSWQTGRKKNLFD